MAFIEDTRALYEMNTNIEYAMLQPLTHKVGSLMFTSFKVVYNWKWMASTVNPVSVDFRSEIGLNSLSRQRVNVLGVALVNLSAQLNSGLLRRWISRCDLYHETCTVHLPSQRQRQPHATLLIDVLQQCLVLATTAFRYCALSYVWGQVAMFKTTLSELESLKVPNSFAQHQIRLPRLIRDSMILVQMIGERYLWVDAPCIVQDDLKSKQEQTLQKDEISSAGLLTIIPSDGNDANAALSGIEPDTRLDVPLDGDLVITKLPTFASLTLVDSKHESRA